MWPKPKPVMEGVYLYISGRVQGVGFRAALKAEAEKLGVAGWCKNTSDNCVETVLIGETLSVRQLLRWCKQGPPNAFVTDVEDSYIASSDPIYQKTLHLTKNGFLILEND